MMLFCRKNLKIPLSRHLPCRAPGTKFPPMEQIRTDIQTLYQQCRNWLTRDQHKQKAAEVAQEVNRAFTRHPQDTGETYWQHLWFTVRMSGRLLYGMAVLMVHGLFPFLLTREGSKQIEKIYRIMKTRIPKPRLDAIDLDYHV